MKNERIYKLVISALLIAIGIIIPMFSPLKIVMEPASFTLGSHVAIFIAMFISPAVAVAVAVGTTLGFFLGGFPLIIVLRAASHIVFAIVGAMMLYKTDVTDLSVSKLCLFSLLMAVIHAICELVVVSIFYTGGRVGLAYYEQGFFQSVLLLVGLGTIVHSMVDIALAYGIARALKGAGVKLRRQQA